MSISSSDRSYEFPKLRLVDIQSMVYRGRPSLVLRDPLRLTERLVLVPQALAPLLMLCDGTCRRTDLWTILTTQHGVQVTRDQVEELLDALDEALMLENEHAAAARAATLSEYRAAPFRTPALASRSYSSDPGELRAALQGYLDAAGDVTPGGGGRGVVSPHIDYGRGGAAYARVWKRAAASAKAADLAVILGTDHYGAERLTLTRQHYATPFGVLPTAVDLVDALADRLGHDAAFAGELRHRTEHSVELAAVWLHFIRDGQPCEVVPVLCGSFEPFVRDGAEPRDDPALQAFVDVLREKTAGRRVLVVSAADLAHVGPAFGGEPVDRAGRAWIKVVDAELVARMCAGDAEGFYGAIKRVGDRYNVCGLPPTYLALRLLGGAQGEQVAYDRCSADDAGTSLVSICGVVLK